MILFSISAAYYQTKIPKIVAFFVIYFILFILFEYLDLFPGFKLWKQSEITSNCYDWFEHYLKKDYGLVNKKHVFDLTENLYLNNFDISSEESLENKYNLIFNELQLTEGKTLLDCGSGSCAWTTYCKNRGVNVTGLTLSKEQQSVCTKKGIPVYVQDYRILDTKFINKFDAVSLIGTTEHITEWCGFYTTENQSYKDYKNLFNVIKQYLKPNGKIFLSQIVRQKSSKEYTMYDYVQAYVMLRHYGGYYSYTNIISDAITYNGLTIESINNYTRDYHWISVVEKDHFGHWWVPWEEDPLDKILYFFRGLVTDPFLVHHWLYYGMDTWMWQFSGYQKTPLTNEQIKTSIGNLKYFVISK
jgi:cyclopropane fatty-acyl-phospholipid synthase-like methyltransferase